jgi:hypothetical protein
MAHNCVLVDAGFADRRAKPMSATIVVEITGNTIAALRRPVVVITTRAQTITSATVSSWKANTVLDKGVFVLDTDLPYPDAFWVDHFEADLRAGNATSGGVCEGDLDCASGSYRGLVRRRHVRVSGPHDRRRERLVPGPDAAHDSDGDQRPVHRPGDHDSGAVTSPQRVEPTASQAAKAA